MAVLSSEEQERQQQPTSTPGYKPVSSEEQEFIKTLFVEGVDEPLITKWVQQHKGKKTKNSPRLIVVSHYRIMTLTKTLLRPIRVSKNFSLLDLQRMKVYHDDLIELVFRNNKSNNRRTLKFNASHNTEAFTRRIQRSLGNILQNFPPDLLPKIDINTSSWLECPVILSKFKAFSQTYQAFCDYYKTPVHDSVLSYLECMANSKEPLDFETCFRNCRSPPVTKYDALPLLSALQTCSLYTSISITSNLYLHSKVFEILSHNPYVATIKLSKVHRFLPSTMASLKKSAEAQNELAYAEMNNNKCQSFISDKKTSNNNTTTTIGFKHLYLSDNPASLPAVAVEFAAALRAFKFGLLSLNISNCRMNYTNHLSHIISALRLPAWTSCITELNLANNHIGKDGGTVAFADWISCSFALKTLVLASTSLDTFTFFNALKANAVLHKASLETLDVSYNKINMTGATILGEIMKNTCSLSSLVIKGVGLTKASIEEIVRPMYRNTSCKFSLDLSDNDLSSSRGKILADIIRTTPTSMREKLVLNNCCLDEMTLGSIVDALSHSSSLHTLSLEGNNANNVLSKVFNFFSSSTSDAVNSAIGESFTKLLTTKENCVTPPHLRELYVSNSSLMCHNPSVITTVISALRFNTFLQVLDISGNLAGDSVAEALATALPANKTLKALFWDKSRTTVAGFQRFNEGLQLNHSIVLVPIPIQDTKAILESRSAVTSPREELFSTFRKIYEAIERNQNGSRHDSWEDTVVVLESSVIEDVERTIKGAFGDLSLGMKDWQEVGSNKKRRQQQGRFNDGAAIYKTLPANARKSMFNL